MLCAFLAARRLPGWRLFAGAQGASWIYLGIAAIVLRHHSDSWGLAGGVAAVLAGIAVVVIASRRNEVRTPLPVTV